MEKLLEQLENNYSAIKRLKATFTDINEGSFQYGFYSQEKRLELIEQNLKVQKRVFAMRHTVLENINLLITKKLQAVSVNLKSLNTLKNEIEQLKSNAA